MHSYTVIFSTLAVVLSAPMGGHSGLQNPPFLRELDQQAVQEYLSIVNNGTSTIRQQKLSINDWASRNNMTDQWNGFNSNQTALQDQKTQNITNVINQLPSASTQYKQIMANDDQTYADQQKAIKDLASNLGATADVFFYIPKAIEKNLTGGAGQMGHGQGMMMQRPVQSPQYPQQQQFSQQPQQSQQQGRFQFQQGR